ncbi:hypothetical protein GOP47_0028285 [Adiantum capillus-veneris]|nr:hypothetical protein GOP47_0028285 [Adiantum capillus-veneris]
MMGPQSNTLHGYSSMESESKGDDNDEAPIWCPIHLWARLLPPCTLSGLIVSALSLGSTIIDLETPATFSGGYGMVSCV